MEQQISHSSQISQAHIVWRGCEFPLSSETLSSNTLFTLVPFLHYHKILELLAIYTLENTGITGALEIYNNIQLLCTMCPIELFINTDTNIFFSTLHAYVLLHTIQITHH